MKPVQRVYADGHAGFVEPTVLALIPARGGSRRIPRKNLLNVGGKPMLAWSIEAAKAAGLKPYVSTEDTQIASVALEWGAEVIDRPAELATDSADSLDVCLHALEQVPADVLVLLQPTSPFRAAKTITACLETFDGNPVVTVSALEHSDWHYRVERGLLISVPPLFKLNGSVYVVGAEFLRAYRSFTLMAKAVETDTVEGMDIDTPEDLRRARDLIEEQMAA